MFCYYCDVCFGCFYRQRWTVSTMRRLNKFPRIEFFFSWRRVCVYVGDTWTLNIEARMGFRLGLRWCFCATSKYVASLFVFGAYATWRHVSYVCGHFCQSAIHCFAAVHFIFFVCGAYDFVRDGSNLFNTKQHALFNIRQIISFFIPSDRFYTELCHVWHVSNNCFSCAHPVEMRIPLSCLLRYLLSCI